MKGITHFTVGVMVATFFAYAVEAAVVEKAWLIVLGGIFGLLPDFLDFKLGRFFEKHDYEIAPEEGKINAKEIAETISRAIDEANIFEKPVKVKLHTIKVGADMWRRYSVRFIPEAKEVEVKVGPIVSTGQWPYPGTEPPKENEKTYYRAKFTANLEHTYEMENHVDIFSGPDFEFVKDGDRVICNFIPWHRRWSHSFTVGILFMPMGFMLYGITTMGFYASLIIFAGFASHIVTDQLGVLGSNLFYPFTKKRTKGLGLFHSGNVLPNMFTNYIAIALIIWNLNAYSPKRAFDMSLIAYLLEVIIIPLVVVYLIAYATRTKGVKKDRHTIEAEENIAEGEEEGYL